jgi:effector-binding domain-containing protein
MAYEVRVELVAARLSAVVRCRASSEELSEVVPKGCGEVWDFFRANGLPRPGRNLAVYFDDQINLDVGVEVSVPFDGNDRVVCSSTPAGWCATTTHWGPYDLLGEAHEAVLKWCSDHGREIAGPSWEIYGHWDDDPSKLRTDVCWLLSSNVGTAELNPSG